MIEFDAGDGDCKQKLLLLERVLKTKCEHDRIVAPACARYAGVEEAVLQQGFENGTFRFRGKPECGPLELLQSHTGDKFSKINFPQIACAGRRAMGGVHAGIIEAEG